jgi:DNA-binding transcriptional ArsR family regulator
MKHTRRQRTISTSAILEAAEVLKCIGHPTRLEILEFLDGRGEQNVTAIQEAVGLDQPTTSQHLGLMRDKGIVASRRDGVNVLYRVHDEKVTRVLDCIRDCDV